MARTYEWQQNDLPKKRNTRNEGIFACQNIDLDACKRLLHEYWSLVQSNFVVPFRNHSPRCSELNLSNDRFELSASGDHGTLFCSPHFSSSRLSRWIKRQRQLVLFISLISILIRLADWWSNGVAQIPRCADAFQEKEKKSVVDLCKKESICTFCVHCDVAWTRLHFVLKARPEALGHPFEVNLFKAKKTSFLNSSFHLWISSFLTAKSSRMPVCLISLLRF